MTFFNRKEWGAREDRGLSLLDRNDVRGVALHWPGTPSPLESVAECKEALRDWQRDHMDNPEKRWADIAYQLAFDQQGNVYKLRGIRHKSAANGDTDVNEEFGAFLLMVAIGEKPSAKMIAAVRRKVRKFRRVYPNGHRIVSHSSIRPGGTECPGDKIRVLISQGAFIPRKGK